jgi:L-ribulose-5-phosphate 4-epimerase
MSWSDQRELFVATCRRAVAMGLQMSTGGNLSLRLPDGAFLVKPSGIGLYDLAERDLLVVDAAGTVLEGTGKPTKELTSHLAVYDAAPRVGAVVHYHSPFATAFAVAGKTIPLLTVHARRTLGSIPVLPAAPEGSRELALALAEVFRRGELKAVLLGGHGMLAAGAELEEAQALAELVEESAKVARLAAGL